MMQDKVAKTLVIPLYCKARDAKSPHPVVNDTKALEVLEQLDIDTSQYQHAVMTVAGTIARTQYFDEKVREFIENNPRPVVVNIGSGLDARTQRVYSDKAVFFEIDLPEVIELRKKYLSDLPSTCIAADAFDTASYFDQITIEDAQYCFVIEGVLMYFPLDKVLNLLCDIFDNFHGLLVADVNIGDFWQKNKHRHDVLKNVDAPIPPGLPELNTLNTLRANSHLVDYKYYNDKAYKKLYGWRWYLFYLFPKVGVEAMVMVTVSY